MLHNWIQEKLLSQLVDKDVISAQKRNGFGSEFFIDENIKNINKNLAFK